MKTLNDDAELAVALARFCRCLGGTRLMEVPRLRGAGRVFAKVESENITGSVKARAAYAMLRDAARRRPPGPLTGWRVLEYSGGNLGLALAELRRLAGFRLTLVLSEVSPVRLVEKVTAQGADVVLVERARGFHGVIEEACLLARNHPDWSFLCQHENAANPQFHRRTTGAELLRQLPGGRTDAWVAAVGTGGTLVGVHDALAAYNPAVRLYTVTPAEMPYGTPLPPNDLPKFAGAGGLGLGRKQPFLEPRESQIAGHYTFTFEETLRAMREFHAETGVAIGSSAAANLLAARDLACRLGPRSIVATLFPDAGSPSEWKRAGEL